MFSCPSPSVVSIESFASNSPGVGIKYKYRVTPCDKVDVSTEAFQTTERQRFPLVEGKKHPILGTVHASAPFPRDHSNDGRK